MARPSIPVDRMDSTLERDHQAAVCTRIGCRQIILKVVYTTPERCVKTQNFPVH